MGSIPMRSRHLQPGVARPAAGPNALRCMRAVPPLQDHVLAAVRSFVVEQFCDGQGRHLRDDTGLVTTGLVDSAGVVELVQFLERRFDVVVADDEVNLDNFNTLGAMAALVAAKLG